jgi:hypothetical protein
MSKDFRAINAEGPAGYYWGKDRRLVRIPISFPFLIEMMMQNNERRGTPLAECTLGLPEGATFINSYTDNAVAVAYMVFQHESFEVVEAGDELPILNVTYTRRPQIKLLPGLILDMSKIDRIVLRRDERFVEAITSKGSPESVEQFRAKELDVRKDMKAIRSGPVEETTQYQGVDLDYGDGSFRSLFEKNLRRVKRERGDWPVGEEMNAGESK